MVIIKLTGGIGNQLFIYAAGRALAHRLHTTLYVDTSYYFLVRNRQYRLDYFQIIGKPLPWYWYLKHWMRLDKTPLFREKKYFHLDPSFFSVSGDIYLDGWWQHPKYFANLLPKLLRELQFQFKPSDELQTFLRLLRKKDTVSVHVRRGDMTKLDAFGICSQHYYEKAIQKMRRLHPKARFIIFSDDMPWSQEHLGSIEGVTFAPKLAHEIEDLFAMSLCRHHILANSTFSWWGSVLAKDPKGTTIAPTPWVNYERKATKALYLPHWIVLARD